MSVVAALLAVRLLGHPALSADDVFFLDAGRHVTEEGRLAMGLWGNALGHETLLASYPPLMPLVSAGFRVTAMSKQGWYVVQAP